MIKIDMTPEQFAKARAAILSSSLVLRHKEATETDGSFDTAQVGIDYSYADGVLAVDVTAKRGMARFATEAEIEGHMQAMLGTL